MGNIPEATFSVQSTAALLLQIILSVCLFIEPSHIIMLSYKAAEWGGWPILLNPYVYIFM